MTLWAHLFIAIFPVQVFAEKMGLETGWNCHISLTPNGDMPGSEIPPSSPSHTGSLHDDLNQGEGKGLVWTRGGCGSFPFLGATTRKSFHGSPPWKMALISLRQRQSTGWGGRTPRNRKFCVICKARKGPQKSGPKVRDRLLSPQCPEMMRKGSS